MFVLIAHEDPVRQAAILHMLRDQEFSAGAPAEGLSVSSAVRDGKPDIIVLSCSMPPDGGIETCRRLRVGGNTTPILVVSRTDDISTCVDALDASADACMTEPLAAAELNARIRALLRRLPPS